VQASGLEDGAVEIATPIPEEEDHQREGQALQLLSQLDPRQRTVLQEVVLGGHSLRHTARLMDLSPMTVHRLLARGLAQLRRQLAGEADALNPGQHPRRGPSAAPAC
jgi:RNA polymerase sigma-B factor